MKTLKLALLIFVFSNVLSSNKPEIIKNSINELNYFPKELANIICDYSVQYPGVYIEFEDGVFQKLKKIVDVKENFFCIFTYPKYYGYRFGISEKIFIKDKIFINLDKKLPYSFLPSYFKFQYGDVIIFPIKRNHLYILNTKIGNDIDNIQNAIHRCDELRGKLKIHEIDLDSIV